MHSVCYRWDLMTSCAAVISLSVSVLKHFKDTLVITYSVKLFFEGRDSKRCFGLDRKLNSYNGFVNVYVERYNSQYTSLVYATSRAFNFSEMIPFYCILLSLQIFASAIDYESE